MIVTNEENAGKFLADQSKDFLIEDLANDHEQNERRFESIERRLRVVEKRGSLLPDIDEENMMFYLMAAYVLFGFVLPAVIRLFEGEGE
jgi:hypothetical protein